MEISKKYEEKILKAIKPYIDACSQICWLMVLIDPPMFADLSLKEGDKFDPAHYSGYSQSGKIVHYLVWPPLYNCLGGGLLSKGVAETKKVISKK